MGRVARYKKVKKTFDVDHLHARDDKRDDAVKDPAQMTSAWESKSRQRSLLVKWGPEGPLGEAAEVAKRLGKPVLGTAASSAAGSGSGSGSGSGGGSGGGGSGGDGSDGGAPEKRRAGESMREFNSRVEQHAQAALLRKAKKASAHSQRTRAAMERKKQRATLKKRGLRAARLEQDDDMGDKERRIYGAVQQARPGLAEVAKTPPVFTETHLIKKGATSNPNDRSRFAKLSFVGGAVAAAVKASKAVSKSDYERMQFEAMRVRVLDKYKDLKEARKSGKA
jgi:hypothetical protein